MARLFLLDVPEFRPFVAAVREDATVSVTNKKDYVELSAPAGLRIERGRTGLKRAVWYGALTGGYIGKVERFDDDLLLISGD